MARLTEGIKHLLIINVLFFIATALYGDQIMGGLPYIFLKTKVLKFGNSFSHMFMHGQIKHGGIMHIGFNMFALWMFGSPVEQNLGKNRFLFLYFSAGFGAVLFQLGYYYYSYLPVESDLISLGLSSKDIIQMISTNQAIEGLTDIQLTAMKEAFPIMRDIYIASMVGASGCIMGVMAGFWCYEPP